MPDPALPAIPASQADRKPQRNAKGQIMPGFSGNPLGNANRARKELNADTIREMHRAFRRGGAQAINKVMRNNPAMFLKMLVLLVPREMQIEHSSGVKAMSDEQLDRAIEYIEGMIARRDAGASAKVINQVSSAKVILGKVKRTRKPRIPKSPTSDNDPKA